MSHSDMFNIPALISGIEAKDAGNPGNSAGQFVSKQMLIGTVKALVEYFDERITNAISPTDNQMNYL